MTVNSSTPEALDDDGYADVVSRLECRYPAVPREQVAAVVAFCVGALQGSLSSRLLLHEVVERQAALVLQCR